MAGEVNHAPTKQPLRWTVCIGGTVSSEGVPDRQVAVSTMASCLARAMYDAQLQLRLELHRFWEPCPTGRLHAELRMEVDQWTS